VIARAEGEAFRAATGASPAAGASLLNGGSACYGVYRTAAAGISRSARSNPSSAGVLPRGSTSRHGAIAIWFERRTARHRGGARDATGGGRPASPRGRWPTGSR